MSVAVGIAQPLQGVASPPQVDQHEEQRRADHAADRRGDRQRGPARIAQVAGDELPLELQPGDEEEDRQQPVGGPGAQRQVQVQRGRADAVSRSAAYDVGHGGVRPHQRDHRGDEQQRPADRLLAQDLGDPRAPRPTTRGRTGDGRSECGHGRPSGVGS